jgi:hypothetical protein
MDTELRRHNSECHFYQVDFRSHLLSSHVPMAKVAINLVTGSLQAENATSVLPSLSLPSSAKTMGSAGLLHFAKRMVSPLFHQSSTSIIMAVWKSVRVPWSTC